MTMELAIGGIWPMDGGRAKRIKVSDKRQITIPIQFFKDLNIGNEVECTVENGALVIRPVASEDAGFALEILKDLVAQGYTGDQLVQQFAHIQQQIRPAVKEMIANAEESAKRAMADPNYDSEAVMVEIFGERGAK
jgi:bifunctional DNA-binding transcriptional regulator/antitoxin component of YhaV-PrlF toxin-antitoxin module